MSLNVQYSFQEVIIRLVAYTQWKNTYSDMNLVSWVSIIPMLTLAKVGIKMAEPLQSLSVRCNDLEGVRHHELQHFFCSKYGWEETPGGHLEHCFLRETIQNFIGITHKADNVELDKNKCISILMWNILKFMGTTFIKSTIKSESWSISENNDNTYGVEIREKLNVEVLGYII